MGFEEMYDQFMRGGSEEYFKNLPADYQPEMGDYGWFIHRDPESGVRRVAVTRRPYKDDDEDVIMEWVLRYLGGEIFPYTEEGLFEMMRILHARETGTHMGQAPMSEMWVMNLKILGKKLIKFLISTEYYQDENLVHGIMGIYTDFYDALLPNDPNRDKGLTTSEMMEANMFSDFLDDLYSPMDPDDLDVLFAGGDDE